MRFLLSFILAAALFLAISANNAHLGWLLGTTEVMVVLWAISGAILLLCLYELKERGWKKLSILSPFLISIIAVSIIFTCKFSGYKAYGDCLFNEQIIRSALYTKDGKIIKDGTRNFYKTDNYFEYNTNKCLDVNCFRWIQPQVIDAVGGPYFYYLENAKTEQIDEYRDYEYDDNGEKVYYQKEIYELSCDFIIFNSKGEFADNYAKTVRITYFPEYKKINSEEYEYKFDGKEYDKWDSGVLHDAIRHKLTSNLEKHISSLGTQDSSSQTTTTKTSADKKSQTKEQSHKPQKHERTIPVQHFKACPSCFGGGLCSYCNGSGVYYHPGGSAPCAVCGGFGKCSMCAGRGGEYITEYETIVEYY